MATKTVIAYGEGGFDPTKPDNNIAEQVEVEVSDAEVALDAATAVVQQQLDPDQPNPKAAELQNALATIALGGVTG